MVESIRDLRKKAEVVVEDMPDGELKLRAFEIAFRHLLEQGSDAATDDAATKRSVAPQKQGARKEDTRIPQTVPERISALKADRFFESRQSIREVQTELRKYGWHYRLSALSGPLQILVRKRVLRREHLNAGKRKIWAYSNY